MNKDDGRVLSAPGSREPSPTVSAASGFDPSRIAELRDLDAEREAANRACPVRNHRPLLADGSCPKCRATSNQGCGPVINAEYRVAECVRMAFRASAASVKPTFDELLRGAEALVARGRGAVNCTYTLAAQGKAYPRTCRRCGLGPCAFTQFLLEAASDSDGSPKGGDACGSVHDSAGPKDIAPKVPS